MVLFFRHSGENRSPPQRVDSGFRRNDGSIPKPPEKKHYPVRLDDYSEPQPDLALLRFREDFYETGKPTPADILLLIEVSDSSIGYDRGPGWRPTPGPASPKCGASAGASGALNPTPSRAAAPMPSCATLGRGAALRRKRSPTLRWRWTGLSAARRPRLTPVAARGAYCDLPQSSVRFHHCDALTTVIPAFAESSVVISHYCNGAGKHRFRRKPE